MSLRRASWNEQKAISGDSMRSSSGAHYIALDHVRALAAFMVFAWHFTHAWNGAPNPPSSAPGATLLPKSNHYANPNHEAVLPPRPDANVPNKSDGGAMKKLLLVIVLAIAAYFRSYAVGNL